MRDRHLYPLDGPFKALFNEQVNITEMNYLNIHHLLKLGKHHNNRRITLLIHQVFSNNQQYVQ